MSEIPLAPPLTVTMRSDALAELGTPPLYGSALAHVMFSETHRRGRRRRQRLPERSVERRRSGRGRHRHTHALQRRLASEVGEIAERLPVDLGVMSAATGAAEALKLLLEACTVPSFDDPPAPRTSRPTLPAPRTQLAAAAERLVDLFQAGRDTSQRRVTDATEAE